jgi:hypothetical protein
MKMQLDHRLFDVLEAARQEPGSPDDCGIEGDCDRPLHIHGDDLDAFGQELDTLWNYLARTMQEDETVTNNIVGREIEGAKVQDLLRGVSDVKSAVELAKALSGCFEIGG